MSYTPTPPGASGDLVRYLHEELQRISAAFETVLSDSHSVVFDDYVQSGLAVTLGASAPTLTAFRNNVSLYAFAGSGPAEQVFFTVHILHGIKRGTPITLHVHFSHSTASPASGAVKWNVDWTLARGYQAGTFNTGTTTSSGTMSVVTTVNTEPYVHHITDDDSMTIPAQTELEPDSVLLCRLYRDAGDAQDTFAGNAFLINIDSHYQKDKVGTVERNRPFDSF